MFWEEKNWARSRERLQFSQSISHHFVCKAGIKNSFNPGFNSALTLTVNYSWMRSPSRYRCDTVSEKQNTHIWKRDKKKKTRSIRLLQSNVEPTTNLIPSIKFVSCEVSRLCRRALQAFKYRSNRNYLLMITPILNYPLIHPPWGRNASRDGKNTCEAKKVNEKVTMYTHLLRGMTGFGRVTYGKWPVVD